MKRSPTLLLSLAAAFSSACDPMVSSRSANSFDPRAGSSPYGGVEEEVDSKASQVSFHRVKGRRGLPSSMLRPNGGEYRLGQGDKLDIELIDNPTSLQECAVMPDGLVYFDLAEGVPAEGRTVEQLTNDLTERLKLSGIRNPLVRLTVKELASQNYAIMGQVRKPGTYPLPGPVSLLDAVAQAGGMEKVMTQDFQNLPDLDRAYMVRGNQTVPVDFRALLDEGDMSQNIYLAPGDYIYIPSSRDSMIYVLGAVSSPRALGYRKGATIASVLAEAGGPTEKAYREKVGILRGSMTNPQVAVVNFKDILKGGNTNFTLQPGDVIWVPDNPWELAERYLVGVVDAAAQALAIYHGGRVIDRKNGARATIGIQP